MKAREIVWQPLLSPMKSKALVPVVTVHDVEWTWNLVQALQANGIDQIEITLRTPEAWYIIEEIKARTSRLVSPFYVGVGTILTEDDLLKARDLQLDFAVSPGFTQKLVALSQSRCSELLWIPGACTPTEVMTLYEAGFRLLKYFPAEVVGGPAGLKAFLAPFPMMQFIPTGGIAPIMVEEYRRLENVAAIGGSWMIPDASEVVTAEMLAKKLKR